MNLRMDDKIAEQYQSNSQKIRVITEQWVNNNLFCPYCGKAHIAHFENNRPVADFYCPDCAEEYELKSKNGTIENKINDGAEVFFLSGNYRKTKTIIRYSKESWMDRM